MLVAFLAVAPVLYVLLGFVMRRYFFDTLSAPEYKLKAPKLWANICGVLWLPVLIAAITVALITQFPKFVKLEK